MRQLSFHSGHWKYRFSHGGSLRQSRTGRKARPLSTKQSLHLVLKANRACIRGGFRTPRRFALIHHILQRYQARFFIRVEQVSIQGDHLHLLIRTARRSNYQNFFRVLAGQIAQRFEKDGLLSAAAVTGTLGLTKKAGTLEIRRPKLKKLWKYRPFSRVIKGWRAYQIVRNYIQLNEKEALGTLAYRKQRLRGLSSADWALLWA